MIDAPLHMDRGSRCRRVYEQLLSCGLIVSPVTDDRGEIDHLIVRVDLPPLGEGCGEKPAVAGVGQPVLGTKVEEVVSATEGVGNNVTFFPTKF